MTQDTTPGPSTTSGPITTSGPSTARPALPPGAGVHSLQLDIVQTRDELAATLDDLFATFNPAVQIRSHPVLYASIFLAATAAATAAILTLRRGRARARR